MYKSPALRELGLRMESRVPWNFLLSLVSAWLVRSHYKLLEKIEQFVDNHPWYQIDKVSFYSTREGISLDEFCPVNLSKYANAVHAFVCFDRLIVQCWDENPRDIHIRACRYYWICV
jgi:hypothetical protein